MGIKDLIPSLKDLFGYYPDVIPISDLEGKVIAIDSFTVFYAKYKTAFNTHWKSLKTDLTPNKDKIFDIWANDVTKYLKNIVSNNILPILVIDGERPEEKQEEAKARSNKRVEQQKKLNLLLSTGCSNDELRKCYNVILIPSSEEIEKLVIILVSMGYPLLRASGEGEELACCLVREKYADMVMSSDTDPIAYGTENLIRELTFSDATIFRRKDILEHTEFSSEQLLDFCIMSGCDYNKRVHGLGPVKITEGLRRHGNYNTYRKKNLDKDYSSLKYDICVKRFSKRTLKECLMPGQTNIISLITPKTPSVQEITNCPVWSEDMLSGKMFLPVINEIVI